MKTNLTRSSHTRDRLELAHCTAAGVLLRDRRETKFIPFHGSATVPVASSRVPRDEIEFPEGRRGRPLTVSVLPENFQLKKQPAIL